MREKEIEAALRRVVTDYKGWCLKWTSPSLTGIPDRMILLPGGKVAFVEVKAPGKGLRPLQLKRIEELRKLGFRCYVINNMTQIPVLVEELVYEYDEV